MMDYELVLRNGRILDGCGNPWFRGDLAIQEGRIASIGPVGSLHGRQTLDMQSRYIAPGFIDIHTHSDLSILVNRQAESAVRQGVTTHVLGNCGMSPAPVKAEHLEDMRSYWGEISTQPEVTWQWQTFKEYLAVIQAGGVSINIASLAGHAALRLAVMGYDDRDPSETEMAVMKDLLQEAMQSGAFGFTTGLVYPPGCFAGTDEIIALCKTAAAYNGFYASHIRGERETILEAVAEAIYIGKQAGLPVQVSHNAPKFGAPNDARANLGLVDAARMQGQDVTVDNDVHTDLAPALVDALPQRFHDLADDLIKTLLQLSLIHIS